MYALVYGQGSVTRHAGMVHSASASLEDVLAHSESRGIPVPTSSAPPRRTGARRPTDVPAEVLAGLAAGLPSVNHMEQMALDMSLLLSTLFPEVSHRGDELRSPRFLERMRAGGVILFETFGDRVFELSQQWESDTARGWAAFAVPLSSGDLSRHLSEAIRFAVDPHFAVREWAWLGVRPSVSREIDDAIEILARHTADESPLLRRFCSEASRPKGVWSAHIPELLERPWAGLPVLEPLRADRSRYVADSVGNWLNDASKKHPEWVVETCARWLRDEGDSAQRSVSRALRNLGGAQAVAV